MSDHHFPISELKKLKTYKMTMVEISVNFFHAIFKGIEKLVKSLRACRYRLLCLMIEQYLSFHIT